LGEKPRQDHRSVQALNIGGACKQALRLVRCDICCVKLTHHLPDCRPRYMETFILASLGAASLSVVGYFCGHSVAAAKDARSPTAYSSEARRREALLHEARNLLNAISLRLFELQQRYQSTKPAAGDDSMARLIGDCMDDAMRLGRVLAEIGEPSRTPLPQTPHFSHPSQHDPPSRRLPRERTSAI
jgi:hypothetical protein